MARAKRFRLRISFDAAVALVLVIVVAAYLVYIDRTEVIDWIGGFELDVELESPKGEPPSQIDYAEISRFEADDPSFPEWVSKGANFKPLEKSGSRTYAYIRCSGLATGVNRELRYSQSAVLALRLQYERGEPVFKFVAIPPRGEPRRVTVSLP
jgi:hypothetical protein